MRRLLCHIILVFCASILPFWEVTYAEGLTLEAFLKQVDQANPDVIASALRARAFEHRVGPINTLDDPFFAVGPDEVPFRGMGSVTRFQLSQIIPFPGKLGARGAVAEGRVKAASADAETTQRQVRVVATQTFFRAFFNQEAIELNEKLRRIVNDTAQSTKARYETGGVSHHDWLLARVEVSVLDIDKLKLEREQRTLYAFLNELRNEPPEAKIERVILNTEWKLEDFNHDALIEGSPEIKSLDAVIEATEKEKRLAGLSHLPDFVLQGMAMTPNSAMGEPPKWGVMVGFSLPIFFWRKQSESFSAAKFDLEAALFEKRSLANRLRTEIVDAKQQHKTAKNVVELYQKTVIPNTQLAVDNARSGYVARRLLLSQFLEVLKIQRTQELEFVAAKLDVQAAELRLREVLSAPPLLRLAPSRPTLFGAGAMGTGGGMPSMGASDTVRIGSGMSGPTRKQSKASESSATGKSGMGGM